MTIRAPYQVLHSSPYKKYSFEREVFLKRWVPVGR